jgi:lipoate-protein ligase A
MFSLPFRTRLCGSLSRPSAPLISLYSFLCRSFSSSPSVRILFSDSFDPFFNLAYEECLLAEHIGAVNTNSSFSLGLSNSPILPSTRTLFLWRNHPSVIIGRYQNPYRELFVDRVQQEGIHMVRRKSGGGAVYQDLGNSIFTFIGVEKEVGKQVNNEILLNSLSSLGISAQASGRNDLLLNDSRKISGHAFQRSHGLLLHHGTLLIDVDFTRLQSLLNPNKLKLQSKGVQSVIARVANVKEINPTINAKQWNQTLANQFEYYHTGKQNEIVQEFIQPEKVKKSLKLMEVYNGLKDWQWRFGSTPPFSHEFEKKFEWGLVNLLVQVADKGLIIQTAKVYSDALIPALIEQLENSLNNGNVLYSHESMSQAVTANIPQIQEKLGEEAARYACEFDEWIKTLQL